MEQGIGDHAGGIIGLLALIEEHRTAVEYDLIALGLRLRDVGTERFTWHDLFVVVHQSPRSSALFRAINPDEYAWGVAEQVMAQAADALNVLVWFKTKDGQKGRNQPDRIPRPGVQPKQSKRHVKATAMPVDELRRRLGMSEERRPVDLTT